jgi:hypothetical protein
MKALEGPAGLLPAGLFRVMWEIGDGFFQVSLQFFYAQENRLRDAVFCGCDQQHGGLGARPTAGRHMPTFGTKNGLGRVACLGLFLVCGFDVSIAQEISKAKSVNASDTMIAG